MGKELGYEGNALQQFVKQQQENERAERHAEWEFESDKIVADNAHEEAKIAAKAKDRELEECRIATEEAKLRVRIEVK